MVDPLTASAISWGFSAVGWLISPLMRRFINRCLGELGTTDLAPQFPDRKEILLQNLDKLQATLLPKLLVLTDAAEQSSHRPFLEKWIQTLKSAFYEAEHALGLVEYERLEKEVNHLFSSTSKFNFINLRLKVPKSSSEKKTLIKSLENLEKLVMQGMEFVSLLNLPSTSANYSTFGLYRATISTPDSTVIGRDMDRDHIVKLLRENFSESTSNADCFSVIAIWGMGGSGKTTLAQYVCEYEKKAKHFDLVIWAHVSQIFDVHAILEMIWESAFKEACPTFDRLEELQSELKTKLKGQMFFLVLDDVWCDKRVSEDDLEQLFAPLRAGKRGSKILVTTRFEKAAQNLGAMNPIPLRELDEDQFFSLFMSNALGSAQIEDNSLSDKLASVGKKIAAKLCGSPLAAKIVASQLRRRLDTEFWSSMLNKSLLNDTMGVLYLSYQNLHPSLQRCVAFCSFFPKGHVFEHDHLVSLWIAEGFVEIENTDEHEKDIANRYIMELVSCSFFQVSKHGVNCYSIHDLIHEIAQRVSQGECFGIKTGVRKEIPSQIRHLYVVADMLEEYVKEICKLENLCTIVVSRSKSLLKEAALDALFVNLRKLRVVDLQNIESLPKSVILLKNLRYLSIEKIKKMDAIPESINKLYQLRSLCICKADRFSENQTTIPDVGRLILLQDLMEFHVRKRRGFELKQLRNLRDLSGSLSIYGLQNVENKKEAHQVKLSEKMGLQKLSLYWVDKSEGVIRNNDVEVLDGLCPPSQLKELVIKGYNGHRLPKWILENNHKIIHLKRLKLDCSGLETLIEISELSDILSLTISRLYRLKYWVVLPLNLTRLKISDCLSLAFALKEDLERMTQTKSMHISRIVTFSTSCLRYHYGPLSVDFQFSRVLEMINLNGFRNEQELSTISNDLKKCIEKRLDLICQLKGMCSELSLPPALEKLSIKSCFIADRILVKSLKTLNSVIHLALDDIITIMCITDEMLSSLTRLKNLKLHGCLLLASIDGWDTHSTLEKLQISYCPILTLKASVVVDRCNTVEQTLSSCNDAKKTITSSVLNYVSLVACRLLDDSFQNIVSLETLSVSDCPTISNPHISYLKSLIHMSFYDCKNLVSLIGLSELNHLKELNMIRCQKFESYSDADKLSQLKHLSLNMLSQIEQLISADGFSSLVSLKLCVAEEEYLSQKDCEVFHKLPFLETISFFYCKMRKLPNLLALRTLISLDINGCVKLTSLSELPPSVKSISIKGCNEEFTKSCRNPRDLNWKKISHIPEKDIQP